MTLVFVIAVAAGIALLAAILIDRKPVATANVSALIDRIDALLPQTQCRQCTYAGCKPYAQAIAAGDADFNQCPPGGNATAARLAALLGREPKPVNPEFGEVDAPMVAFVDEERCIGCALCLPACPVDAIIGATRHTHTVIVDDCTGCKLCIAPCPVDCIEMRPPTFVPSFAAIQATGGQT